MICLIQRALQGAVNINGQTVANIEKGLVVLVGFESDDSQEKIDKMAHKLLHYRLFADADDKMNLNVQQVEGSILLVPQFTLAADTKSGLRPSFSSSAPPAQANALFDTFVTRLSSQYKYT